MEDTQEQITRMVDDKFTIIGFEKSDFALEYMISERNIEHNFENLVRDLEEIGFMANVAEMNGYLYVIVQKFTPRRHRILNSAWAPRILFAVVVGFVMIDGYYKTIGINTLVQIGDPIEMAIIYTISLLGILGIHELGHMVAAKIHRLKTTWPFFIPGIPIFGIPTFGALIQSKGLTPNRRILFDVAVAGPIAGLIIAMIVAIYGAYMAPTIDTVIAEQMFEDGRLSDFSFGEPLLLSAALDLFGKDDQNNKAILTPVLWAAWIGFFITFLNLMPAWQLDGGHMARTVLGAKIHKYTTYASFIVLAIIGFEIAAIIFYFWSRNSLSAQPLDDTTQLSNMRKLSYIGVIAIAILCVPIPENICVPLVRTLCIF